MFDLAYIMRARPETTPSQASRWLTWNRNIEVMTSNFLGITVRGTIACGPEPYLTRNAWFPATGAYMTNTDDMLEFRDESLNCFNSSSRYCPQIPHPQGLDTTV